MDLAYKTSKDYKRLKELLDKGLEIIVFNCRYGVYLARKGEDKYYLPYNMGFYPTSEYNFRKKCIEYEIEFIEPTQEE